MASNRPVVDDCARQLETELCANSVSAQSLRIVAVFAILASSALGVGLPWLGQTSLLRRDRGGFLLMKAFAAGVILATGFVHMSPGAVANLTSSCLGWPSFPWAGAISTLAAIATQMLECAIGKLCAIRLAAQKRAGATRKPAANHAHSHDGQVCTHDHSKGLAELQMESELQEVTVDSETHVSKPRPAGSAAESSDSSDSRRERASHHLNSELVWEESQHAATAQVLEMGIAFHSVLIGVAIGVSQSPCTIRPLLIALCFHQFFEGLALGGCLVQATFSAWSYALMAAVFALTTPVGVAIGIGVHSSYNENSPAALAVSGVFDAISTGILIYMALVDLIAVDFKSIKMRNNLKLELWCYVSLLGGAVLMSILAIWA